MGLRILAALLPVLPAAAILRHRHYEGAPRWDLQAALADSPPGAYFQLMKPVAAAITLGYCHAEEEKCDRPQTITANYSGGGTWERLRAFEQNPQDGGVFNMVFLDRSAKRAILAFKGGCLDHAIKRCRADLCFLSREKAFGGMSNLAYGNSAKSCTEFGEAQLDYVNQARNLTKSLQDHLGPDHSILFVGHSMGGLLSMMMAMEQPKTLQAVTFSPSPFHTAALDQLLMTEESIHSLPGIENRVALGDPFDLVPNTALVPLAREGALSCVFDDWDEVEPAECNKKARASLKDGRLSILEMPFVGLCKKAAHNWYRYTNLSLARQPGGDAPRWLPNCSSSFSVNTPGLISTMDN